MKDRLLLLAAGIAAAGLAALSYRITGPYSWAVDAAIGLIAAAVYVYNRWRC